MRRRVTAAFGALIVAGSLAMTTQSALAATGDLVIKGQHHPNPRGCYPAPGQASIANHTDTRVTLHMDAQCSGSPVGQLSPAPAARSRPSTASWSRDPPGGLSGALSPSRIRSVVTAGRRRPV